MKIKINAQNLIDEQKKSQERCIELIGKGTFKTIDLEKLIEKLKNINEFLKNICMSSTTVNTKSCGGSTTKSKVPTITQSKLFIDNENIMNSLIMQIDIAKVNNLEFITDFSFSDDQILNYGLQKNIIRI